MSGYNKFNSKQASEMRQCMQPYIHKILNFILLDEQLENKAYYLKDNQYGSVHIFAKPFNISNPELIKEICSVEAGTKVLKIKEQQTTSYTTHVKVKVLDGNCINKLGWVNQG